MTTPASPRTRIALATFGVTLALLAGCSGTPIAPTPTPTEPAPHSQDGYVDPFIMNHDHADANLHALAFHAKQLYHHKLGGDLVTASGAHVVDVRGNWLFVGTYGATADYEGGIWVFDITNPEAPVLKGTFHLPGSIGGDRALEATDDGNWIVLGTEPLSCANQINPFGPGIYLLDARDKAKISISDYLPGSGTHSVAVHRMKGVDYVVTLGSGALSGGDNVWKIANGKLVGLGSVGILHDMTFFDDPLMDNKTYLYVANQDDLRVYDFSDPAHLSKPYVWSHPTDEDYGDVYVHAVTVNITEGQRIVALESEDWDDKPSPLWILNMTDFKSPELLTTWVNPAHAPANAGLTNPGSLAFSTHNPRFENGILHMAHYHGGAWMLDMTTLNKSANPQVMAYFLPHDADGYKPGGGSSVAPDAPFVFCFGGFNFAQLPLVMDLEAKGDVVYVTDLHTGLYAYKYDPTVLPKKP